MIELEPSSHRLSPSEKTQVAWGARREQIGGKYGILLEGPKLLDEALRSNLALRQVWFRDDFPLKHPELARLVSERQLPSRRLSERGMKQVSDLDTPPIVAAVADQPESRLLTPHASFRLIVALFGAQDPGNAGTIIRTSEYFGVDEVWLDPSSADPWQPKVIRGSMGSILRLPVFRGELADRITQFTQAGATPIATIAHGDAPNSLPKSRKPILMLGSEGRGLNQAELDLAKERVRIAGSGRSESLNIAVAAGILIASAWEERSENVPIGRGTKQKGRS